jgi:hypothetical protein
MNGMRRWFFTFLFACVLFLPTGIYAAADPCAAGAGGTTGSNFVPLACYKGTALENVYSTDATNKDALAKYLNNLFRIVVSICAIGAVIRVIWAGYLYMDSDSWSKKGHWREVLGEVTLGIILLAGTYLLFYQINPCMLNFNILSSFTGGESCPA